MATGPTTIDYEALQQDALRGVVRAALIQISNTGLPGEHHFFISFLTQSPGVVLSKRLKEKYPHEMTIVLQHRFWDLLISDERFEVKLTFDGIPERLVIPFASIKVFIDPSVRFGLQFEENAGDKEPSASRRPSLTMDAAYDQAGEALADGPRATLSKKPRSPRKAKAEKDLSELAPTGQDTRPATPPPVPAPAAGTPRPAPVAVSAEAAGAATDAEKPADTGAKILSLDQFRKK